MADNEMVIVCMKVKWGGVVVKGSVRRKCSKCLDAVWVSPASLAAVGPDTKLLCMLCCEIPPEITLLPGQMEEVRKTLKELDKESN